MLEAVILEDVAWGRKCFGTSWRIGQDLRDGALRLGVAD